MVRAFTQGSRGALRHCQVKSGCIGDIRALLGLSTNEFNPYRQRLIRKDIISGEERDYVRLLLPFFDQYVLAYYDLD